MFSQDADSDKAQQVDPSRRLSQQKHNNMDSFSQSNDKNNDGNIRDNSDH